MGRIIPTFQVEGRAFNRQVSNLIDAIESIPLEAEDIEMYRVDGETRTGLDLAEWITDKFGDLRPIADLLDWINTQFFNDYKTVEIQVIHDTDTVEKLFDITLEVPVNAGRWEVVTRPNSLKPSSVVKAVVTDHVAESPHPSLRTLKVRLPAGSYLLRCQYGTSVVNFCKFTVWNNGATSVVYSGINNG